jgi:hypothetical protein
MSVRTGIQFLSPTKGMVRLGKNDIEYYIKTQKLYLSKEDVFKCLSLNGRIPHFLEFSKSSMEDILIDGIVYEGIPIGVVPLICSAIIRYSLIDSTYAQSGLDASRLTKELSKLDLNEFFRE